MTFPRHHGLAQTNAMAASITIRVYSKNQQVCNQDIDKPLVVGRQGPNEPPPYALLDRQDHWKLVIAPLEQRTLLSRNAYRLTPGPNGHVVKHLYTKVDDKSVLKEPGTTLTLPVVEPLPTNGDILRVEAIRDEYHTLDHAAALPIPPPLTANLPALSAECLQRLDNDEILRWLQAVVGVMESAANSDAFYTLAAKAAVEMLKLDAARVLALDGGGNWQVQAEFPPPSRPRPAWSSRILGKLLRDRKTCWQVPEAADGQSLAGAEAVIAAPILCPAGGVIGALYGERLLLQHSVRRSPITKLEAKLVELLAGGIALGRCRLDLEQQAARWRTVFGQFFTADLADRLMRNQGTMLAPTSVNVTVLFCDIQGFSRICQNLPPQITLEWTQDVLEMASQCVLDHGGVLVDYIGDALMALWGAPDPQPDHADRACNAALDMLARLPELSDRWAAKIYAETALAIGVNTGAASVGNTGAKTKFKYGALGDTVNLASRIQAATRHFQCPLLISSSTQAQLKADFPTRRLAKVRVHNIDSDVGVYELLARGRPDWPGVRDAYDAALRLFEAKRFGEAARAMGDWRADHPDDGPAKILLYRAVRCMVEGPTPGHPVWPLGEK